MEAGNAELSPKVYTGLNEQHSASWIEKGWGEQSSPEFPEKLRKLDIDERITNIVSECINRGEKTVNVIDIGSGSEGYFIKSFLNKEEYSKLHQLLENHAGITLHIIGITGNEGGKEQGLVLSKDESDTPGAEGAGKNKVLVENYGYTITKAQTLGKFLSDKGITAINAGFSTFGIGYFTPNNFEQCLTDVADHLAPGGEFYGISWDAVPAGSTRGLLGLFSMHSTLRPEHPLNKVFGGFSSNKEFERFYAQSPEDQISEHLGAIDFELSRGFITPEQAKYILTKRDVLPIPAFVRSFQLYTSLNEQGEVMKYLGRYLNSYPWVSKVDWVGKEDLFDRITHARTDDYVSNKEKPQEPRRHLFGIKWPQRGRKTYYENMRVVEDGVWAFIEKRFAADMRQKTAEEKKKFDQKIANLNWTEVKEEIKKLDPRTVARFWDWDRMLRDMEELFIDKQAQKTTDSKQASINKIAQWEGFTVYTSRHTEAAGLNVYIGRKQVP
jgi:hypothetical protein